MQEHQRATAAWQIAMRNIRAAQDALDGAERWYGDTERALNGYDAFLEEREQ